MGTETKREGEMSMQEMMEIYKKYGTPSAAHKEMAKKAGSWNVSIRSWMSPDESPNESTGTSEVKSILDGRFILEEFSSQMQGNPYKGIGFMGYDNRTSKFVSTWMDSMSTSVMWLEGTASADGKTITQTGKYDDPIRGTVEYRGVTKLVNDNTFEFELFNKDKSGKEWKTMELKYTRK